MSLQEQHNLTHHTTIIVEFDIMPSKRKKRSTSTSKDQQKLEDTNGEGKTASEREPSETKQNWSKVAADSLLLTNQTTTAEQALEWCQQARHLWLNEATIKTDLETVECLYRSALNAKKQLPVDQQKKKQRRETVKGYAALSPSDYRKAGERLSLLYLQSGRPQKVKSGLKYLGFTCRLSEKALNYPINHHSSTSPHSKQASKNGKKRPPACILDNFLSEGQFNHLQNIFGSIDAEYWTGHDYAVEPPSPYFSYIRPIRTKTMPHPMNRSFLDSLIQQILHCPPLRKQFPLLSKARFVEMWAHNRPHASGHQMHFDSDNEGIGGVRNPIVSTILYLSEDDDVGGPSLITNQRLQSTSLSNIRGWLAYSNPRRMVAFDGTVLHGVIPGKGVAAENKGRMPERRQRRRVTLMLAFWKDIEMRDSSKPGAARPWPEGNDVPSWAQELHSVASISAVDSVPSSIRLVDPVPIGHVYEDLDGYPLPNDGGMPEYEEVFQGF